MPCDAVITEGVVQSWCPDALHTRRAHHDDGEERASDRPFWGSVSVKLFIFGLFSWKRAKTQQSPEKSMIQ